MTNPISNTHASELVYIHPRRQFRADAQACGAPEELRAYLHEHDALVHQQHVQTLANCAALCSGLAITAAFSPALVRAAEHCLSTISPEALAGCGSNAAPALGALFGLTSIACSGYGLYLDYTSQSAFVARMDAELRQRFLATLQPGEDARRIEGLMSRYNALSKQQRACTKDELLALCVQDEAQLQEEKTMLDAPTDTEPACDSVAATHHVAATGAAS
jgi:hypothetical protein